MRKLCGVILAGGKGSRMNQELPKALVPLNDIALIDYGINSLRELKIEDIFIVYSDFSKELLKTHEKYNFVYQNKPLGAGHAFKLALKKLDEFDDVIVISCDMPLIETCSYKKLIQEFYEKDLSACYLTTILEDPTNYGRIVRFENGFKVVEEADVDETNKEIKEVNVASYCFKVKDAARLSSKMNSKNKKQEYLITDLAKIFTDDNLKVDTCVVLDSEQFLGVNSQKELEEAKILLDKAR